MLITVPFNQEGADHVMADIETIGVKPGSVIASIGLVRFKPDLGRVQSADELLNQSLKVGIDLEDSLTQGFSVDGDTLKWWLRQSDAARKSTFEAGSELIGPCLQKVLKFFKAGDKIWGNGANFDTVLMEAYFDWSKSFYPWKFYNVRCFRTLKTMNGYDSAAIPANTLPHDCVADAIFQVQTAQAIALANPNLKWK